MSDLISQYGPMAITALVGSTFATKYVKIGYAFLTSWVSGIFKKMPPGAVRIVAILAGMVAASASGQGFDPAAIPVGAITGAVGTLLVALLNAVKPKRPEGGEPTA